MSIIWVGMMMLMFTKMGEIRETEINRERGKGKGGGRSRKLYKWIEASSCIFMRVQIFYDNTF